MLTLHPHHAIVAEPCRPRRFAGRIASHAGIVFERQGRRQIAIYGARDLRKQTCLANIRAAFDGKNVVVSDVERVYEVRSEYVVPITAISEVIVGLTKTLGGDLDWK